MKSEYVLEIRKKIGHMAILNPVVTLIIYKEGKILLQKRADNGRWAIHGGGIEPGENYLDALRREIKEELNIEPINPTLLGIYSGKELFNTYPNGDQVYALDHTFICTEFKGTIKFNDGEVNELKWFDLNNLPDNIFEVDKPVINDVETFMKNKIVIVK